MLRIKKIIYAFFIVFFVMNFCKQIISYATTSGIVYLQSNKEIIEVGEEVEISFNIKQERTASYLASIYFDETKLEFVSAPENVTVDFNEIKILWFDEQGGNGTKEGELGKIIFKAKEKGLANFVINGEFFTEKGQEIKTDFENLQIQIGKEQSVFEKQAKQEQGTNFEVSNANLKSLRIDIEGLIPDFSANIYEYDLIVSNEINDIDVLAITENPNAKVEITGNTGLKEGLNIVKIKVVSEDQTQNREYIINVTKTADLELANTNLETLAIENVFLNPAFDNHITYYKTQVSNEITKLNILAIPENENASVQIIGNDSFNEGNNTITIIVTAPNGFTKRTYQINVYKRNEQEETVYKQEQQKLQDKLNQAYDIEKASIQSEKKENLLDKSSYWIIGVILTVVATVFGIIIHYGKNH